MSNGLAYLGTASRLVAVSEQQEHGPVARGVKLQSGLVLLIKKDSTRPFFRLERPASYKPVAHKLYLSYLPVCRFAKPVLGCLCFAFAWVMYWPWGVLSGYCLPALIMARVDRRNRTCWAEPKCEK